MRSVWKFSLTREYYRPGGYHISMPHGAIIRHIACQGGETMIWAEVDTDAPRGDRKFLVVCTGDPIPADARHVGSYTEQGEFGPEFVYHVFEVI
jgi:hypothetical protein